MHTKYPYKKDTQVERGEITKGVISEDTVMKIGNTWSECEEVMKTFVAKKLDICICLGGKNIALYLILRRRIIA